MSVYLFMRSVQSQIYETFDQIQCEENCVVDSKSRKSCKKCRFKKCVFVGMKISYVQTFEERRNWILKTTHKISKPLETTFLQGIIHNWHHCFILP